MSLPIYVESYSRHRANERPLRFTLDDTPYDIASVEDRWYEPDAEYFKVLTTDGKTYLLRYKQEEDVWTLQSGLDGDELLTRLSIKLIAIDESQVAQAQRRVEYCEQCHPDESEIPFDWLLQEVTGSSEMTDFLMVAIARCPNCGKPITEKTLIGRIDDE